MPVSEKVALSYTDLGIAGAALLVVLVIVILFALFAKSSNKQVSKMLSEWQKSENIEKDKKVDKLCDKIDSLVTVINTGYVSSGKDQKMIIELLNQLILTSLDTNRRMVRVDLRTFMCKGNPSQEEEAAATIENDEKEVVSSERKHTADNQSASYIVINPGNTGSISICDSLDEGPDSGNITQG